MKSVGALLIAGTLLTGIQTVDAAAAKPTTSIAAPKTQSSVVARAIQIPNTSDSLVGFGLLGDSSLGYSAELQFKDKSGRWSTVQTLEDEVRNSQGVGVGYFKATEKGSYRVAVLNDGSKTYTYSNAVSVSKASKGAPSKTSVVAQAVQVPSALDNIGFGTLGKPDSKYSAELQLKDKSGRWSTVQTLKGEVRSSQGLGAGYFQPTEKGSYRVAIVNDGNKTYYYSDVISVSN